MKSYTCIKRVKAAKIRAVLRPLDPNTATLLVLTFDADLVEVPADFVARAIPNIGDYVVQYEDGYLSHSPGSTFESGYVLEDAPAAPAV